MPTDAPNAHKAVHRKAFDSLGQAMNGAGHYRRGNRATPPSPSQARPEPEPTPPPPPPPPGIKAEIVPFRVSDMQVLDIVAFKTPQGKIEVVLCKMCDMFGVNTQDQTEKIREREDWVSRDNLVHIPGDPVPRKVFCLDIESVTFFCFPTRLYF